MLTNEIALIPEKKSRVEHDWRDLVIGMATYQDDAQIGSAPHVRKGNSFGITGLMGFDFMIGPNAALGFDVSYLVGTVAQGMQDGLSVDMNESLNRFDFNGGLKYYW